jgi:hypothetical protein
MKFNKKQIRAIENLIYDLDELDNKPRRLYGALRDLAKVTIEDKEQLIEILSSLDEAERYQYFFMNLPDIAEDIFEQKMRTERELLHRKEEDKKTEAEAYEYKKGVGDATKSYSKKMLESLINYYN